MTTTIPDLWSDDVKATALPPVAVLKEVLQSSEVRAVIHSLIARINGQPGEAEGNGSVAAGEESPPGK